ncbi:polyunsaturated fatty acid 5-lipoxygenase-like isoform X2 [Ctenopharyngodon idella]|uniref:polyunsaturated fatty acid 5-lipoxygenase-like isoform X2 n=1 Tax=Ctenopharyngodon idella TaxID=7959 RepID=UPI00222EF259|nr:polyunsaturated fatty acid 5-lipoxygenase-like isoform X2 [Ctenopharyngodon idella]
MLTYKVLVSTDRQRTAETKNSIYLTLLDSNNQSSERTLVKKSRFGGMEREISFDVCAKKDLGDIVQVKLEKEKHFVNFQWFCKHIKVKTPSEKFFEFPCHRWLVGKNEVIIIREGSAQLPQDDTELLKKQRQEELESTRKIFRIGDSFLDKFKGFIQSWKDLADFEKILEDFKIKNTLLENVMQDWSKDYMFGYQFLNGCNPVMIRKCMNLPDNFPVRHEMVDGFLRRGATLQEEIKAGNIYIADYEILDGVPASSTRHYLTAPICLLYKNRLDQIVPIAIQLSQNPGEKSPIFLPSDNEYDWMLAKMWVKSSDFNVHQLVTHLLKTHLISEVFEIAMYRQLSAVHPVHKLLKPHVRFTIAINAEAREKLVSDGGVFSKISSIAGAEMEKVIKRAMETLTYESLCFPEAIKARGMEDIPKYFYRDDGMKIWEAINCFVSAVVEIYYDSDETVQKDVEIQEFVKDVSFGMNNSDKFPKSLKTREELAEYLTVVIFTASAQHAAVNFGQFDWYGWIPNSPSTMRKPPPEQKGQVDLKYIMDSLPDRGCSSKALGTVWALSQFQKNELFLGTYPDMCFTEQPVKEAIKTFRKKLDEVTNIIKSRNEELTLDYCYLSPDKIPNSVAV